MFRARDSRLTLLVAVAIQALRYNADASPLPRTAQHACSDWPGFRGPEGGGIGASAFPVRFGPQSNVAWSVSLPPGHSSPCVVGPRIFLTAFAEGKLELRCLRLADGSLEWNRTFEPGRIERGASLSDPAASTPAADHNQVYTYFGSLGLLCHRFDGAEVWRKPLPVPVLQHGPGTSPVIAGDKLVLNADADIDGYLLAVDKRDGRTLWRTARPSFRRGFATPLVWPPDRPQQLILPGTLRLVSYRIADGSELWSVNGLPNEMVSSPVGGADLVFVAGWTHGSGVARMPPFEDLLARGDSDRDGWLTRDEAPPGPAKQHFHYIDADKNGRINDAEYAPIARAFDESRNVALAVRPDGQGEVTATHVVWTQTRGIPYVPSPLYYEGRLYLVKNGGLASCFEARTGRALYAEERLGTLGDYYASPVAAAGLICAISQPGTAVVYRAGDTLEILARNPLGEPVVATPAIVEGAFLVRTRSRLYAFRELNAVSLPARAGAVERHDPEEIQR